LPILLSPLLADVAAFDLEPGVGEASVDQAPAEKLEGGIARGAQARDRLDESVAITDPASTDFVHTDEMEERV
jgi:hypothetical protein